MIAPTTPTGSATISELPTVSSRTGWVVAVDRATHSLIWGVPLFPPQPNEVENNNPGTWSAIYGPLKHAEWHGITPTDQPERTPGGYHTFVRVSSAQEQVPTRTVALIPAIVDRGDERRPVWLCYFAISVSVRFSTTPPPLKTLASIRAVYVLPFTGRKPASGMRDVVSIPNGALAWPSENARWILP